MYSLLHLDAAIASNITISYYLSIDIEVDLECRKLEDFVKKMVWWK